MSAYSPPYILSLPIYAKKEPQPRNCAASFLLCGGGGRRRKFSLGGQKACRNYSGSGHYYNYDDDDDDNDSMTSSIVSISTLSEVDRISDIVDYDDLRQTQTIALFADGDQQTSVDHCFDDVTFDENGDDRKSGKGFTASTINEYDSSSLLERSRRSLSYNHQYNDLPNYDSLATKYIVQKRRFRINYTSPSKSSKTFEGLPILAFPDKNVAISYSEYKCLISYLHHNLPYEDCYKGYVIIIDRRFDKWTNVKNVLTFILNYFPAAIKAIYLVKPNGVFQRALEVGFKNSIDHFNFPLIICNLIDELHCYINPSLLTADLQGDLNYDHFEWARNCIDVEKMKASAKNISDSLIDFADFLRDGDMFANDADTTRKLMENQRIEHVSIKRDFTSVRKQGFSLLQQIRRVDLQPNSELLAPTRLHHVTVVERLLLQLEDTEKSFDGFWNRHEFRLNQKLHLRSFEEEFRKLQTSLSRHISHIEERREIGNNVDSVNTLISKHRIYMEHAEETIKVAEKVREKGENLMQQEDVKEMGGGSLKPKCDELQRMNQVLLQALENRLHLLRESKGMHEQIGAANAWCTKGVELLTNLAPLSINSNFSKGQVEKDENCFEKPDNDTAAVIDAALTSENDTDSISLSFVTSSSSNPARCPASSSNRGSVSIDELAKRIDDFLTVGHCLKFDSLGCSGSSMNVLSKDLECAAGNSSNDEHAKDKARAVTTDTSVLLDQVGARISDIRRMCENRKTHLQEQNQSCFGSPLKSTDNSAPDATGWLQNDKGRDDMHDLDSLAASSASTSNGDSVSDAKKPIIETFPAKAAFVLDELLTTEKIYVHDLSEIVDCYFIPFRLKPSSDENTPGGGRTDSCNTIFGNLQEITKFHKEIFLPELTQACRQCPKNVARCFLDSVAELNLLYHIYCRNKCRDDQNQELENYHAFFQNCQLKAGHLLPLGAYLLKPVQRITKYQLLLRELVKSCRNHEDEFEVTQALQSMLDLLNELNSSFAQTKIIGYPGDVYNLGPTLIHGAFIVWHTKRMADKSIRIRRNAKAQRRHLFLFEKFLLLCKSRRHSSLTQSEEYFEYKFEINLNNINVIFDETKNNSNNLYKFEIAVANNNSTSSPSLTESVFICQPIDPDQCAIWINKLNRTLGKFVSGKDPSKLHRTNVDLPRCQSWKPEKSNPSSASNKELCYSSL